MDAPLTFGCRHALHAVTAGLELELGIGALADDADNDLLVAAELAVVLGDDLRLPAVVFGIAQVHAQKVARKEGGLVAACARTDFKEDVAAVVGVLGQKQDLKLVLDDFEFLLGLQNLLLSERLHFGVLKHSLSSADVHVDGLELEMLLHDGLNVGTLLRECAKLRHVAGAGRVGEHAVDFLETAGKLAEFGTHVVVDHDGVVCR